MVKIAKKKKKTSFLGKSVQLDKPSFGGLATLFTEGTEAKGNLSYQEKGFYQTSMGNLDYGASSNVSTIQLNNPPLEGSSLSRLSKNGESEIGVVPTNLNYGCINLEISTILGSNL